MVDQYWGPSGSPTDNFTYTYDRDGNRLTRTNLVNTAFSEQYGYDAFNQLTSFMRGGHVQTWGLDVLGNWTSFTSDGVTESRTHNLQNQITGLSGVPNQGAPQYDADGNTTQDEFGDQLTYDAWNRLVKVKSSSGMSSVTLATYRYDVLGRRTRETHGMTTTDLYFSSRWQVLEEQVGGATTAQYVWSPVYIDALVERDAGGTRLYVQQDANFNVTGLVNTSGQVVERYAYDPYGKATVLDPVTWMVRGAGPYGTSSYGWVYLHQGGRYDTATGLYNFRNRDLSPTLERWMQEDPIGYETGNMDLYDYARNTPEGKVDPFGLDPIPVWPGAFGGSAVPPGSGGWIESKPRPPRLPGGKQGEAFRKDCRKSACDPKICECILEAFDYANQTSPRAGTTNTCTKWVDKFQQGLKKCKLGGSGVQWNTIYFEFKAFLGLTDGHCAFVIRLPDGKLYFFDNGAMGGITDDKGIPKGWSYDPRSLNPKHVQK